MELINKTASYIEIDGVFFNRENITAIGIERDGEGKERFYLKTATTYGYIYGKKKIKEFLAENFRKDTINEIEVR